MGQQYIETIGMYGKKEYKEWASERQCYAPEYIGAELLSIVFNKQYGIFYYEPADETEAIMMISKFKDKIAELEAKYVVDEQ